MRDKNKGRPKKEVDKKLCHSINLKLTATDIKTIRERATKIGLTATQYARQMTLKGAIKNRFTAEELNLMRKISGVANNLNQITKHLNSTLFSEYMISAMAVIVHLKKLIDDSKK